MYISDQPELEPNMLHWELTEQQNSITSTLYKLPEELIVQILHQVQLCIDRTYIHWRVPELSRVLLTCRRFWLAGIHTPNLWSHIVFGHELEAAGSVDPRIRRLCIDRCLDCPMDLTIYFDPKLLPVAQIPEILELFPRMRRCDIEIRGGHDDGAIHNNDEHGMLLRTLLTTAWPLLEVLNITGSDWLTFNRSMFGGYSDTIIAFRCTGPSLNFDALPSLPRLRQLELGGLFLIAKDGHAQIIEILTHMRQLNSLKLHFYASDISDGELTSSVEDQRLQLFQLKDVSLVGPTKPCLYVLLKLPGTYKILNINIIYNKWTLRNPHVEHHNKLIHKALTFARQNGDLPLVLYQLIYSSYRPRWDFVESTSLELKPVTSNTPDILPGTLMYRVENYASSDIFEQFMGLATVFYCRTDQHHTELLSALASSRCALQEIRFTDWGSRWDANPERIAALNKSITLLRQELGYPLKLVWMDAKTNKHNPILKRWLNEGLIEEIVYENA